MEVKFQNCFEFKCGGTNSDEVPKQRCDRFLSVGDHIHVTPTFQHGWGTARHTVIGGCQKSKEYYNF